MEKAKPSFIIWAEGKPTTLNDIKIRVNSKIIDSPDPKIINLVKIINLWGLETQESCEGHFPQGEGSNYPYIVFTRRFLDDPNADPLLVAKFKAKLEEFTGLLRQFNESSDIKWRFSKWPGWTIIETSTEASSKEELLHLHENENLLAEHIFKEWLKNLHRSDNRLKELVRGIKVDMRVLGKLSPLESY